MFPITLKLTHKILLFVFLTIFIVASAISFRVSTYINNWLDSEVLNKQNKSILVAGSILHRDLPTFEIEKKRDGNFKFTFSELPVFEEHDIIDDVGFITQETATVFLWDEETKDFWRKTTNIKKDDGSRAVGTPLGKKGKVYPYMVKGESFLGTATILGKDYYTRYDPIYKKGTKDVVGILYVGMEKAHFDKVRNDLLHNILLVSCVVAFIMLVISMLVLRRILSKKIALVVSQMHRLSNGDKEFDVIGMDLRDEIGDMNKAIEVFRQNALEIDRMHEQQVINDQRNEEEKRNSLGKIADSFDERVGGLIVNLSESAGILTETAETMRGVADNTSQSSLKVVTASSEVSSNVNAVAAAIEEMSATSNEISSQMLSVKNKSDDTARNAKLANDTVSNLDQLAQNIGEVVVSIQDIAEQTNLLALNATIEAARAGEAGKGFAVVADEVKKLATETAQKTEEISSRITQIQGATSNSVAAMSKIISSVDDIDQAITAVSAAVEEQNVTTNEIVRSVSEASHAVEGVSNSIQDVQNDASLTGESSDNVLNAAQKVSVLSDELRESVNSFVAQIRS